MDRLVGRTLGPYQVQAPLGRGTFGTVYRAVHRPLGQPRALKVLDPRLAEDAELVTRFELEANLAARLRHPNIVLVHDIGVRRGLHFIAMDLVEGRPLSRMLQGEGPLTLDRALGLLEQLAA